jgi:hypothetical protein
VASFTDFVYDLIHAGLPNYSAILREGQSNEIPSVDFIGYDVVTMDLSSFGSYVDSTLYADPDVKPEVIGTFDRTFQQFCPLTVQINCYASTGLSDLQSLCSYARSSGAIAILDGAFASFIGAGVVRNMKYLSDNDYKQRFTVDMDFIKAFTQTEAKDAILEIRATGKFSDLNGLIEADLT